MFQIERMVDALNRKTYKVGDNIIRHGDIGEEFFILTKGRCFVTVFEPDTTGLERTARIAFNKTISADKQVVGFGEISLLYKIRRTATISASSQC